MYAVLVECVRALFLVVSHFRFVSIFVVAVKPFSAEKSNCFGDFTQEKHYEQFYCLSLNTTSNHSIKINQFTITLLSSHAIEFLSGGV